MRRSFFITIGLIAFSASVLYAQKTSVKLSAKVEPVNYAVSHISINNSFMTVTFNSKAKSLELSTKPDKRIFVKNLIPDGATGIAGKEEIVSSTFGKGSALIIYTMGGGSVSFSLYASLPFVFVNQTIKNEGEEVVDIMKLNPVCFLVDLGKPATVLKTLGTGGLSSPDDNPGSYVFLTTVDPVTRNGVVTGWLTNEKGSGVLFSDIKDELVEIKAQIDYGHYRIPAGKSETTETLLIGYFEDARLGEEQFADELARYNNIKLRQRSAVYCTWYAEKNGFAGSESSTIELAKFIKDNLKTFGLGVIQIDDDWQGGGQYNGPRRGFDYVNPRGGYPNGMTITANAIKENGLTAGIWWIPFGRNHQDPEYKDRQHWFARRTNGQFFEDNWGATSLDLTNPEVQNHVVHISKTLQNWGFAYFKLDGLWTGTVTKGVYINDGYINDSIGNSQPLFNPLITQIEAFRNGLKLIRNATANDVFLSGCCISQNMRSFGASIGLVDAMRIGPDFDHDGQGIRTGAIRASRLYFLNGRIWWNDPDPSILREGAKSMSNTSYAGGAGDINRTRLLPSFVAVSGQLFLSSDWLPDLPNDRIEIMKRCMAPHSGTARPVDAFDKTLPSVWVATDKKSGTQRDIIGLFNWDTIPQFIGCSMEWAGLDDKTVYHAFEFWDNKPLPDIDGSFGWEFPAESCRIIALRARSNHPVVVSTSQHVTQGMIDLLKEEWKTGTLSGMSKITGGDNYELRIAGMNDGGDWKLAEARIVENQSAATIEVITQIEKGWLKVVIKTSESQIVKWQLKFKQ